MRLNVSLEVQCTSMRIKGDYIIHIHFDPYNLIFEQISVGSYEEFEFKNR